MFEVADMRESSVKISDAILRQPVGHPVILVGHNGPAGLGSEKHDICGKDFVPEAGMQPQPPCFHPPGYLSFPQTCSPIEVTERDRPPHLSRLSHDREHPRRNVGTTLLAVWKVG